MPDEPSERIACSRPSQELKSPTTLTARADGAHTANPTPVIVREPITISRMCEPSRS